MAVAATVLEELPQAKYRVRLDTGQLVVAAPAGLAARNFVRLLPGDRVEVELASRDWTRGRIVKRSGPSLEKGGLGAERKQ